MDTIPNLGDHLSIETSDSGSTTSNNTGAGRGIGLLLSGLARKVERLAAHRAVSGQNSSEQDHGTMVTLSSADQLDLYDAHHVADALGPGRTMAHLMSTIGRRLEAALTRTSERLGLGPNVIMARTTREFIEKQCEFYSIGESRRPTSRLFRLGRKARRSGTPRGPYCYRDVYHRLSQPYSFINIVDAIISLFALDYTDFHCPKSHDHNPQLARDILQAACSKLVAILRGSNNQVHELALYYIILLISFYPELHSHLYRLGADRLIEELGRSARSGHERETLINPSRRALVCLNESHALHVLKAFRDVQTVISEVSESRFSYFWLMQNPELLLTDDLVGSVKIKLHAIIKICSPESESRTVVMAGLLSILRSVKKIPCFYVLQSVIDESVTEYWLRQMVDERDPLNKRIVKAIVETIYIQGLTYVGSIWTWKCLELPLLRFLVYCARQSIPGWTLSQDVLPKACLGVLLRGRGEAPPLSSTALYQLKGQFLTENPTCDTSRQTTPYKHVSISNSSLFRPTSMLIGRFCHEWCIGRFHISRQTQNAGTLQGKVLRDIPRAMPLAIVRRLCCDFIRIIQSGLEWKGVSNATIFVVSKDKDCHRELLYMVDSLSQMEQSPRRSVDDSTLTARRDMFCKLRHTLLQLQPTEAEMHISRPIAPERVLRFDWKGKRWPNLCILREACSNNSTRTWVIPKVQPKGGYEYLVGNGNDLRWVPASEWPARRADYSPILLDVGQSGVVEYVGCACWGEDRHRFQIISIDEHMRPEPIDSTDLYVLGVRSLTSAGMAGSLYYWVPRLPAPCNGPPCNGHTYCALKYPWPPNDEGKCTDALTLEEMCIEAGETMVIKRATW